MRGAVITTSVHKGFPTTFTLGRGIQFHASCIQGRPCGSWRTGKRFVIMKQQHEMFVDVNQYEAPQVEVIEVDVEKGFATSDPTGTGEDMPWG